MQPSMQRTTAIKSTEELGPLGLLRSFSLPSKNAIAKLDVLQSFPVKREEELAQGREKLLWRESTTENGGEPGVFSLAPTLIREFKRFFSLPLLFPKAKYSFCPSPSVDFVWHQLIVDTMRYADLCEKVHGQFLHHRPLSPDECAENAGEKFGYTKKCLVDAYGSLTPAFWGSASFGCDRGPKQHWGYF
jgi:hypothetical protein